MAARSDGNTIDSLGGCPKIWIPGRHLYWKEACVNGAGALAGFLLFLMLD